MIQICVAQPCGYPIDKSRSDIIVIPKAYMHRICFDRDGRSLEEISDHTYCCDARRILQTMGGVISEIKPSIPDNQWWIHEPESKKITRFRIYPAGSEVMERLYPDLSSEPPKEDEETTIDG